MVKNKIKKNNQISNRELLSKIFILIIQHKKWWLMPFFLVLAFLGLFFSLSGNQSLLPALYALF